MKERERDRSGQYLTGRQPGSTKSHRSCEHLSLAKHMVEVTMGSLFLAVLFNLHYLCYSIAQP